VALRQRQPRVLPPDRHALTYNEYTIRKPPYGPGFEKSKHLHNYIGDTDYVKNIVVDERENPFTGTNYAWVRARCLGRQDPTSGAASPSASPTTISRQRPRRLWRRIWSPSAYSDIAPYYDKWTSIYGITGVKETCPPLPDSIFQRPTKLNCAEVTLKQGLQKMDRRGHPISRWRNHRRSQAQ